MVFYPTAAAAEEAGFRPCLRCRPEPAPDISARRRSPDTVNRALSLIEHGALDGGCGVTSLAERVGVGERHLRRLFRQYLRASPIAVALARRVHLAKQLLHETHLPMSEITLASGFGTIRRFNKAFEKLFGACPSALRRAAAEEISAGLGGEVTVGCAIDRLTTSRQCSACSLPVHGAGRWRRIQPRHRHRRRDRCSLDNASSRRGCANCPRAIPRPFTAAHHYREAASGFRSLRRPAGNQRAPIA
jgi:methylphosphotriester-DNA--protein-cysteine methyltransferase